MRFVRSQDLQIKSLQLPQEPGEQFAILKLGTVCRLLQDGLLGLCVGGRLELLT